jgi:hypothetical protein
MEGDNQGAILAVNHFRSPVPEINEVLQEMFETCAEHNADVIGKWVSRENLFEAASHEKRIRRTGGFQWRFFGVLVRSSSVNQFWICLLLMLTIP